MGVDPNKWEEKWKSILNDKDKTSTFNARAVIWKGDCIEDHSRAIQIYLSVYDFILYGRERNPKVIENSKVIQKLNKLIEDEQKEMKEYEEKYQKLTSPEGETAIWYDGCSVCSRYQDGSGFFEQLTESVEYGRMAKEALLCCNVKEQLRYLEEFRYEETVKECEELLAEWDDNRVKDILEKCENVLAEYDDILGRFKNAQLIESGTFAEIAKLIINESNYQTRCIESRMKHIKDKEKEQKEKAIQEEREKKKRQEEIEKRKRQEEIEKKNKAEKRKKKRTNVVLLVILITVILGDLLTNPLIQRWIYLF